MHFLLLFVMLTFSLGAESQGVIDASRPVTLDSARSDNWYATYEKLEPLKITRQILQKKDTTRWFKVKVPGLIRNEEKLNTHFKKSFKRNTADYFKALFTLSEVPNEELKKIWYKKVIRLNKVPVNNLAIQLGRISDRDRVYVNGQLIGSTGQFGSNEPQGYSTERIYEIPRSLLRLQKDNVILVEAESYFFQNIGIIKGETRIGPAQMLFSGLLHIEYFKVILFIGYLTTALYFIFLFIRRRREYEYLSFAGLVLAIVLYQFLRTQLRFEFSTDFFLLKKIEYISLAILFIFILHFFRIYFQYRYQAFYIAHDVLFSLFAIFFLIHPSLKVSDFVLTSFLQPSFIITLSAVAFILVRRSLQRNLDAILIFSFSILIIGGIVVDVLSSRHILNLPPISAYTFILFIMSLATVLANKFVRLNNENEALNADLEKKVSERTQTLQKSLNKVQAMKEQQDGDYFLTSLLINPLAVNKSTSENVNIDFFVKQKKQFVFRKRKAEIGGDICIAHNIELKNKKYTVFLNGDAMGKSIQGAGGALVLGVVFNSVVERTQVVSAARDRYPEQWLKDCYFDLQGIFKNFNGSMLVSILMGMIDDETGVTYLVNAEHPSTVLYRDQKASFLETDVTLRKLGLDDHYSELQIQVLQMFPRDVIITGSDGKDDIAIGLDEQGGRIINSNDEKFLALVEKAEGNIETVATEISQSGDITDDLTLLRVGYREKGQAEVESAPNEQAVNLREQGVEKLKEGSFKQGFRLLEESYQRAPLPETLLMLVRYSLAKKEYRAAIKFGEEGINRFNFNEDFTLLVQRAYKRMGQYNTAIDHGERLKLRNPRHVKNLLSLADSYRLLNNTERARALFEKAKQLDPDNANVHKLEPLLK